MLISQRQYKVSHQLVCMWKEFEMKGIGDRKKPKYKVVF